MLKKAAFLQAVDLSHNQIEGVGSDVFAQNQFLQVGATPPLFSIQTSVNLLTWRARLPSLFTQTVNLKSNNIRSLPEELLQNNAQLYSFDAGNNYLDSLPPNVFSNNGLLESVHLESNHITIVSAALLLCNSNLSAKSNLTQHGTDRKQDLRQ